MITSKNKALSHLSLKILKSETKMKQNWKSLCILKKFRDPTKPIFRFKNVFFCYFGPWPIYWARRDFRFWGVIFSIWIKIDQVMSILIFVLRTAFFGKSGNRLSENRISEYGSLLIIIQQLCHKTDSMLIAAYLNISHPIFTCIKYFHPSLSSQYAKLHITTQFLHPHKIQTILLI